MIHRSHSRGKTVSTAIYSDCESYRYALTRVWDPAGRRALFIMLNPSTATEVQNDPTVERCERRAQTLGFGMFRVCNIFAWRETDPRQMRRASDPVGPENDAQLTEATAWADQVICGWGTHGEHLNRGSEVEAVLRAADQPLFHLGLTKAGHPRHPLYVAYRTAPSLWPARVTSPEP